MDVTIKNTFQKRVLMFMIEKYHTIKYKQDLIGANWNIVKELCGIKECKKELNLRESIELKDIPFYAK